MTRPPALAVLLLLLLLLPFPTSSQDITTPNTPEDERQHSVALNEFDSDRTFPASTPSLSSHFSTFHPKTYYADSGIPEVVRSTLQSAGIAAARDASSFDVAWTYAMPDEAVFARAATASAEPPSSCKVNHFPGNMYLTSKIPMQRVVDAMQAKFPLEYDIMPSAYVLPAEDEWTRFKGEVLDIFAHFNRTADMFTQERETSSGVVAVEPAWLLKTPNHRGVHIVKALPELEAVASSTASSSPPTDAKLAALLKQAGGRVLLQEYVPAHLIDGHKYDLGFYVVVTSVAPLRAYIFREIQVRFCKESYPASVAEFESRPDGWVIRGTDYKPLWNIPSLNRHFTGSNTEAVMNYFDALAAQSPEDAAPVRAQLLFDRISDRIRKALIAAAPSIAAKTRQAQPHPDSFFELFRFDFLIDSDLRPWLVEVNMSPNLDPISAADSKLKEHLVEDVLQLVGASVEYKDKEAASERLRRLYDRVINRKHALGQCQQAVCQACDDASDTRCVLCEHCLTPKSRFMVQSMLAEHNRRPDSFRLLLPASSPVLRSSAVGLGFADDADAADDEDELVPDTPKPKVPRQLQERTDFAYASYTNFCDSHYKVAVSDEQRNETLLHSLQSQIVVERLTKELGGVDSFLPGAGRQAPDATLDELDPVLAHQLDASDFPPIDPEDMRKAMEDIARAARGEPLIDPVEDFADTFNDDGINDDLPNTGTDVAVNKDPLREVQDAAELDTRDGVDPAKLAAVASMLGLTHEADQQQLEDAMNRIQANHRRGHTDDYPDSPLPGDLEADAQNAGMEQDPMLDDLSDPGLDTPEDFIGPPTTPDPDNPLNNWNGGPDVDPDFKDDTQQGVGNGATDAEWEKYLREMEQNMAKGSTDKDGNYYDDAPMPPPPPLDGAAGEPFSPPPFDDSAGDPFVPPPLDMPGMPDPMAQNRNSRTNRNPYGDYPNDPLGGPNTPPYNSNPNSPYGDDMYGGMYDTWQQQQQQQQQRRRQQGRNGFVLSNDKMFVKQTSEFITSPSFVVLLCVLIVVFCAVTWARKQKVKADDALARGTAASVLPTSMPSSNSNVRKRNT